jgi:hypothetical protein
LTAKVEAPQDLAAPQPFDENKPFEYDPDAADSPRDAAHVEPDDRIAGASTRASLLLKREKDRPSKSTSRTTTPCRGPAVAEGPAIG